MTFQPCGQSCARAEGVLRWRLILPADVSANKQLTDVARLPAPVLPLESNKRVYATPFTQIRFERCRSTLRVALNRPTAVGSRRQTRSLCAVTELRCCGDESQIDKCYVRLLRGAQNCYIIPGSADAGIRAGLNYWI